MNRLKVVNFFATVEPKMASPARRQEFAREELVKPKLVSFAIAALKKDYFVTLMMIVA